MALGLDSSDEVLAGLKIATDAIVIVQSNGRPTSFREVVSYEQDHGAADAATALKGLWQGLSTGSVSSAVTVSTAAAAAARSLPAALPQRRSRWFPSAFIRSPPNAVLRSCRRPSRLPPLRSLRRE